MATLAYNTQTIRDEVVNIICSIKNTPTDKLLSVNDFTELGFDILDVVDIILEVEKTYHLTVPDEVPVYSVDDFVRFIYNQTTAHAG
jgi:acyl carrier protein